MMTRRTPSRISPRFVNSNLLKSSGIVHRRLIMNVRELKTAAYTDLERLPEATIPPRRMMISWPQNMAAWLGS